MFLFSFCESVLGKGNGVLWFNYWMSVECFVFDRVGSV